MCVQYDGAKFWYNTALNSSDIFPPVLQTVFSEHVICWAGDYNDATRCYRIKLYCRFLFFVSFLFWPRAVNVKFLAHVKHYCVISQTTVGQVALSVLRLAFICTWLK